MRILVKMGRQKDLTKHPMKYFLEVFENNSVGANL